jgi:hypothetical protein
MGFMWGGSGEVPRARVPDKNPIILLSMDELGSTVKRFLPGL